jgi:mannosyltransferase OCH1-like enzyme
VHGRELKVTVPRNLSFKMLSGARVTARKITPPRRWRWTGLVLAVFLILINILNLIILTRCAAGQYSNKNNQITDNVDNSQTVDDPGGRQRVLMKNPGAPDGAWIPKIVHITWKSTAIPVSTADWVKQWTKVNPDYAVWFWTDDDAKDFIKQYYSYFLDTFTKYKTGIFRADAMRYFILYHYGGIYADLDIEPLKSLDPIRQQYACVMAREPTEHAQIAWNFPEGKKLACNAFMACRPRHPFMRLIIDMLEIRGTKESNPVIATGPGMLTKVLKMYNNINNVMSRDHKGPNSVFLAPSTYFIPRIDQMVIDRLLPHCGAPSLPKKFEKFCRNFSRGDFHNGPTQESYTDHHWWHSWFIKEKKSKLRNISGVIPSVTLVRSMFERDSVENNDL